MKKLSGFFALAMLVVFCFAEAAQAAWSERTVYAKFFSQNDPLWASQVMVYPYTIGTTGCAITSTAMVLTYYYISTDPSKLNTWLKSNGGYTSKAGIYWSKISTYTGGKVVATSYTSDCWNKAKSEILSGRPCVIKTYLHGVEHWVVVRGYEGGKFTISDPYYTSFKLLQYSGTVYAVVTFAHKVDPGLDVIFKECRDRNGGLEKVGDPINYYHLWGSLTVRDYNGGSYGWCIMTYLYPNAGVRKCYLVRTAFWEKWRSLGGPYSFLGMPITDEYPSFKYVDANGNKRARQDFADGGYMVWYDTYVQIYNWSGVKVYAVSLMPEEPTPKAETAITSVSPNPFNPSTRLTFSLAENGPVLLGIYDVSGRRVRELVNEPFPAGEHSVFWDGRNEAGQMVSSGVYFARLASPAGACTKKLLLLK